MPREQAPTDGQDHCTVSPKWFSALDDADCDGVAARPGKKCDGECAQLRERDGADGSKTTPGRGVARRPR
jgi:hypothetical protein